MSTGMHEGCRTPGDGTIDGYKVPDVDIGDKLGSFVIRQCMLLSMESFLQHLLEI